MVQVLWKKQYGGSSKNETYNYYVSSNSTSGYTISKKVKKDSDIYIFMFIAALFIHDS